MILAKEIFCLNEQGKRANNQDNIYPPKGTATTGDKLFIVCDGVGGEKKGEVASEIVCSSIYSYISNEKQTTNKEKEVIEKGIHFANQQLTAYASKDSTAKRMSTTLSLVYLGEQSIIAAWCGDTRIYHIRDGRIFWKSQDHSLVAELVRNGEITEEEAKSHPQKNIITRSLNALNTNNTVDFHEIQNFKNDDYLLLCTDGLLEQINEDLIFKILDDKKEKNITKHVLYYCEGKTKDNYSMYLIRVGINEVKKRERSSTYRLLFTSIILILCLASVVASFLMIKKNKIASQEGLPQKEIKKEIQPFDTISFKETEQSALELDK